MSVARTNGVLCGTSEASGVTLAAGATTTYTEVDVLGDNTSAGEVELYAVVTFGTVAATAGLNIKINKQRVTGGGYVEQTYSRSVTAVASTTVKIPLGRVSAERFMSVTVQNTDGTNAVTNLTIGYTLFKLT